MSAGDLTVFAQAKLDYGKKIYDFTADTFDLGLITSSVTPEEATADPRWGSGGSTNLSSDEVTPGGNYSTGGPTIGSTTYTLSDDTATFDGSDVTIDQDASNPTNARWGIIYDATASGKQAAAFLDLGSAIDLTAGDLTITWNADGLWTLT